MSRKTTYKEDRYWFKVRALLLRKMLLTDIMKLTTIREEEESDDSIPYKTQSPSAAIKKPKTLLKGGCSPIIESNLEGNPDNLELGSEVEAVGRDGGAGGVCASVECVQPLPRSSEPQPRSSEPSQHGTVTRTLQALNCDQQQYSGLVHTKGGASCKFGITGPACKRQIPQVGDLVTFQVDEKARTANIVPVRKKRRAIVHAIEGGFGFLWLESEEACRLFFHMSEVRDGAHELQAGDAVEFDMLTNPLNGMCCACNVVKIPNARSGTRPLPWTSDDKNSDKCEKRNATRDFPRPEASD